MLPFKLASLKVLDHHIFNKHYKYFHEGNSLSFSEKCLAQRHWCSVSLWKWQIRFTLFLVVIISIIIVKIMKRCLSVCLFLSTLQTYFKLRGEFGFFFCLFVVSCAIAPVTKFVDARLCQLQSDERAIFSIMLNKYFHSLEDASFNSVGWKMQSVRSLKTCLSDNTALNLHGRKAFLYYRVSLYMFTFPVRTCLLQSLTLPSLSQSFLFHWNLNLLPKRRPNFVTFRLQTLNNLIQNRKCSFLTEMQLLNLSRLVVGQNLQKMCNSVRLYCTNLHVLKRAFSKKRNLSVSGFAFPGSY